MRSNATFRGRPLDVLAGILEIELAGLVYLMVDEREDHAGEPIEADYTVGSGISDRFVNIRAPVADASL